MKNTGPNGIHYLIGFSGCDASQINSVPFWKNTLPMSLEGTKMSVLHSYFYEFEPQGITGFLLLSSSHLSIHTWPEYGYVACDVFSCAPSEDTKKIIEFLLKEIKHEKVDIQELCRGYLVC